MTRTLLVLAALAACSKPDPDTTPGPGVGTTASGTVSTVTGTAAGTPSTGTPAGTPAGTPGTGSTTVWGELDCLAQSCADAELGATANNGGADLLPEVVCALEALRDAGGGTDGQLRVGTFGDVDTGDTLVIDGASRDVLRQSFDGGSQGIPLYQSDVSTCVLQPAAWFQGCLDAPSMGCLDVDNWVTSCTVTPAAPCP